MIHHTPEGCHVKLGLNFSRTPGGFRLLWAWYDFASHTATKYRFRLRLTMRPWIIWEVKKWNVIDNYLTINDFELVHKEVLEDLNAMEGTVKRTNESYAYIKPL